MKTKNLEHTLLFRAKPRATYEAIMDQKKHAAFTGAPAKVVAKVGGAFNAHGGYITGTTLELKPGKRIVQAWRSEGWPKGHYSIVTFAFFGKPGGKTQLHFSQIGIPAGDYGKKNRGWHVHYWEPLKKFLEKTD